MVELNEAEKDNILSVIGESGLSDFTIEQGYEKREQFIDNCRFASQVYTSTGRALLIDGEVITIISSSPAFHVDAISRALRRAGRSEVVSATSVQ